MGGGRATKRPIGICKANSVGCGVCEDEGGGLETLPGKLGTLGANALSTWGISALQEGLEEPVQSAYDNLVAKALYDHDRPWYSATDPNAVFNPTRAGSEFALGTAVGGILGGVQTGVSKVIDTNSQIDDLKRQLEAVRHEKALAELKAEYDKYVPNKMVETVIPETIHRSEESQSIDGAFSEPHTPQHIGDIDFSDKENIFRKLNEVQKAVSSLDYEMNCTVTSDGKVWLVQGSEGSLDLSSILSDTRGAYSYHNHPQSHTNYSFSAEDAAYFIAKGEAVSKASDHIYEYTMRRTEETIEKSWEYVYHRFKELYNGRVMNMAYDGMIDADIDSFHETMKLLSQELGFEYERKKKT